MENAKQRILKYIEYQSISVNKFSLDTGLSNSFFNNKSAITSDKLLNIFRKHPELNMDWVITGRGEMLLPKDSTNEWKHKFYELLEKYNDCLEENRYITVIKPSQLNEPIK